MFTTLNNAYFYKAEYEYRFEKSCINQENLRSLKEEKKQEYKKNLAIVFS